MRMLLDTQAFLWYVLDDPRLSGNAKGILNDPNSEVFVSPASFWEVAIKISIGKYSLTAPFQTFWERGLVDNGFKVLPIEVGHVATLVSLPFHHKDPFDRLIVSQASVEGLPLVSSDAILDAYPISRLW